MATPLGSLGILGAAAALVAVVVVALLLWNRLGTGQQTAGDGGPRIRSIAVLPLENLSGDAGEDYFVTGMHEALITDLAGIGLQKVIAKSSADAFKGTKKTSSEVGRELGVDGLVTGSVMRAGDRIRVTANLVHSGTGAIVWANRYDASASDVLTLQHEVVTAIARELRATLSKEQTGRLATKRTVNTAAYDAYLKGKAAMASFVNAPNVAVMDAALARFEEAIHLDPTYAPPHAALSNAYQVASQGSWRAPKDAFPKARSAALRAVELDDELAAAHSSLAGVFLWFDWNWTGAQREIQRALELNPDSVDALTASVTYATLVSGRADDAARTSERIVELDPLNPFSRIQPIWVAFFSKRYDVAIGNAKTLVELQPNNIMGPFFLAMAYAVRGARADVVRECRTVMDMLGGAFFMQFIAECAASLGMVGETTEARRLVDRLQRPPSTVWLDPVPMGDAYAGLRDVKRAVDWYQRGLEERSPNMIYLKSSPVVDLVRQDPRFQAIVSQLNFPVVPVPAAP